MRMVDDINLNLYNKSVYTFGPGHRVVLKHKLTGNEVISSSQPTQHGALQDCIKQIRDESK